MVLQTDKKFSYYLFARCYFQGSTDKQSVQQCILGNPYSCSKVHAFYQLQLLEKDFLIYGDYDINSTASIVSMLKYLGNRTSSIERWVKLKEPSWSYHYMDQTHWPAMYTHHLHIYI